MLQTILITVGIALGVVGITLLISHLVNKSKQLDSKEKFIHSLLPELDCGKCGCPTCEAFSKEIANEEVEAARCPYIKQANLSKIQRVIKKGYYNNGNLVAFVKCKGGVDCQNKFDYKGPDCCWCKESLHSGDKACDRACLGCGDCVKVCRYDALFINEKGVAEVNRDKCTGCGACTYVCPNHLIVRIPIKQYVNVVCNNFKDKAAVSNKCKVGCTSCGLCERICPANAISIKDGQPVIDPEKCISCDKCVGICPNQVISRL